MLPIVMNIHRTIIFIICLFSILHLQEATKTCIVKHFAESNAVEPNIVCVCNATYCDEIPAIEPIGKDEAVILASTIGGKRFERTTKKFVTPQGVRLGLGLFLCQIAEQNLPTSALSIFSSQKPISR